MDNINNFRLSLADRDLEGIDSEFTFSTLKMIASFNADGAHLNKWWVMTPTNWICPCCKRDKSQIVRLNKNNYLTCQLHEHHDHMVDVVKSLFEGFSIKRNIVIADELSERFAIKAAFSLSAYDNTIVCFDCNKADAEAKKIVKAHMYFSFSPREIAEFVKPTPNQEHIIDEVIAEKVWERVKPIFEMRMEFAERFARIASENQDWYQPSERTAKQIERHARLLFKYHKLDEVEKYEPEKLLYNTEPFKGEKSSWRRKQNPIIKKKPTQNELLHLAATRGKFWNRYDQDWICPCCFRKKYECVRPSKKNSWVLEIKTASLFLVDEMNFDHDPLPMCADCIDAAINLGREILELSGKPTIIEYPSSVISLEELSKVIIARSHSKHEFRNNLIDTIIPEIAKRVSIFLKKLQNC